MRCDNFQNNEYIYFGGDVMIYKSGQVGCYGAYSYVKGILPQMGNIIEFEAFYEDNELYCEIVDGRKEYYNFILRDDKENEYWLDCNCGYEGIESLYSDKILHLVGIRKNYGLNLRKTVKESNLTPNYDMNLLVLSQHQMNEENSSPVYFYLSSKFNTAYERAKTIETLRCFGSISPLNNDEDRLASYFNDLRIEDEAKGDCRVNLIFNLSSYLQNFDKRNIKAFLTLAIDNNHGKFDIKHFQKVVKSSL
jgi:hypothetical protein